MDKEHQMVRELIVNDMGRFNGILSGGCMASQFSELPTDDFNDIDVYYLNLRNVRGFHFTTLHQLRPDLLEGTANNFDPNYHHSITSTAENFIHSIHEAMTPNFTWQFIQLNSNYEPEGTSPILTPFDHMFRIMEETFDLEFCKIMFHPKFLYISNLSSVVYRKSFYKFKHRLDELTKGNFQHHTFIENKILQRAEKYKNRGYTITNYNQIESFQLLIKSIHIYNEYVLEMKKRVANLEREKADQAAKLRKEQEKQEAKLKEEHKLALKWLTWDEDVVHTRESHINLHKKLNPLSEWTVKCNIHPKLVYLVLAYANKCQFIHELFDKDRIPLEWMVLERKRFKRYVACVYPYDRLGPHISERVFSKYIDRLWPQHFFAFTKEVDNQNNDFPHSGFYLDNNA
jgi:hypothetical protein